MNIHKMDDDASEGKTILDNEMAYLRALLDAHMAILKGRQLGTLQDPQMIENSQFLINVAWQRVRAVVGLTTFSDNAPTGWNDIQGYPNKLIEYLLRDYPKDE